MGLASSKSPTHILSAILILTGLIGAVLQIINWQTRYKLLLAGPIGTLASAIALASRSGFGERLNPHDDELTMEKKLDDLRFGLDNRTGAIIAYEVESKKLQSEDLANDSDAANGRILGDGIEYI